MTGLDLAAVVVDGPDGVSDALFWALGAAGIRVRSVAVGDVLGAAPEALEAAFVLVHAGLPITTVDSLAAHVGSGRGSPSVVIFTDGLIHVHRGRYLVPPFEPVTLVERLADCRLLRTPTGEIRRFGDDLLRYERELQLGQEIQHGFLPASLPSPVGWELEARFHPAREVAGDFYDGFELLRGHRVGFVIADVCDKGVGSALFMALIRTLLRYRAQQQSSEGGSATLIGAVSETSSYILRNHINQGYFATLFFGIFDPDSGLVTYVNAGHDPPVLLRADGSPSLLAPTGPAVGMLPDVPFAVGRATMKPGDILFTYTDGVTEAKDEYGRFFTSQRMLSVLRSQRDSVGGCTAGALLDCMEERLALHIGRAAQFDDITMMVLRRRMPGVEYSG